LKKMNIKALFRPEYAIFVPLFILGLVLQIIGVIAIATYQESVLTTVGTINVKVDTGVFTSPIGWNIAYNFLVLAGILAIVILDKLAIYRNLIFGFSCIGFVYVSMGASRLLYERPDTTYAAGGANTVIAGDVFMMVSYFIFIIVHGAAPEAVQHTLNFSDYISKSQSNNYKSTSQTNMQNDHSTLNEQSSFVPVTSPNDSAVMGKESSVLEMREDFMVSNPASAAASQAVPVAAPAASLPVAPIEPFKARVLYNYTAADPKELSLVQGSVIEVLDDRKKWWMCKVVLEDGTVAVGTAPSNYLERL
jgi:hypothetical protein